MLQMKRLAALALAVLFVFSSFAAVLADVLVENPTKGDVNANGEIDSMDYVLTKRAYFNTFTLDAGQFDRADINNNDEIDSEDYVIIKRMYFGTFPLPKPEEPDVSETPESSETPDVSETPETSETPATPDEPATPEEPHTCVGEGDWAKDEENHWKVCSCGEKTDVAAHSGAAFVEIQPSTTEQEGIYKKYCDTCGAEIDGYTTPKLVDPVDSKVVGAFDIDNWKNVDDGANVPYMFTTTYDASKFAWWSQAAFAPVEGMENVYEMVEYRGAIGEETPLTVPAGGFVWAAWSGAADGTNGAWARVFMGGVVVGGYVKFTGIDFANKTISEDATAEVVSNSNVDVENNVLLDKSYEKSPLFRQGGASSGWGYDANAAESYPDTDNKELTDGMFSNASYTDAKWVGFNSKTPDLPGYNWIRFDLGSAYSFSEFVAYVGRDTSVGIGAPTSVEFLVSDDGETFTSLGSVVPADSTKYYEIVKLEAEAVGRFVEFRIFSNGWAFVSEVAASAVPYVVESTDDEEPTPDPDPKPEEPEFIVPEETTNLIAGVDLGITPKDAYNGGLTDGITDTDLLAEAKDKWFGFYHNPGHSGINAPDGVATIIADLGEEKAVTEVKMFTFVGSKWGITAPTNVEVFVSDDGVEWTSKGTVTYSNDGNNGQWGVATINENTQFVKITFTLAGTWAMIGEVEVIGADVPSAPATPDEPTPEEPEHTCVAGEAWESDADNHWNVCECGAEMNKAAHTAGDWEVKTPATTENGGEDVKKCTVCGYVLETRETDPIPASVNLVSGKQYEISAEPVGVYTAANWALTDGVAKQWTPYDSSAFCFNGNNTVDRYAYIDFDLGAYCTLTEAKAHIYVLPQSGIVTPEAVNILVSTDGVEYTNLGSTSIPVYAGGIEILWGSCELAATNVRYVRIEVLINYGMNLFDEIEIWGYVTDELEPEHTCTAGEAWESDDENHWKVCECGAEMNKAAHTAGEAWESDADNHWNVCECGYEMNKTAHTAGEAWETDAENHWKVCECGAEMNKAAHTAGDWEVKTPATTETVGEAVKKCTDCQYLLETKELEKLVVAPEKVDNILLGKEFIFDTTTGAAYYAGNQTTDTSDLTDGIYVTNSNITSNGYSDTKFAGFGSMKGKTLVLTADLGNTYIITEMVAKVATNKANKDAGLTEPYTIKAFYKNANGEWVQFGETFTSTETDDAASANKLAIITISGDAARTSEIKFEMTTRPNKPFIFISELEAFGALENAEADDFVAPEETTNLIAGMEIAQKPGSGVSYQGDLTDGVKPNYLDGNNGEWFSFYYHTNASNAVNNNTVDGVGTMLIDLGEEKLVTDLKLLNIAKPSWGIQYPMNIIVYTSKTGEDGSWTRVTSYVKYVNDGSARLGTATINEQTRFVKVEVLLDGTFAFFSEVELYGADVPAAPATPDEVNVFAGVTFEHDRSFYTRDDITTSIDELTDGVIVTDENIHSAGYKDDSLVGWSNMNNKTLTLTTTLDGDYNLNKFVFHTITNAANKGAGMTEPYTIKAFYKNAEDEWVQFGATFTSTETDDAASATKTTVIEISADAVVTSEVKFEVTLREGKGLLFISELEAWGYAAQ